MSVLAIAALSGLFVLVVLAGLLGALDRRAQDRTWRQIAVERREQWENRRGELDRWERDLAKAERRATRSIEQEALDGLDEYWSADATPIDQAIVRCVAEVQRKAAQYLDSLTGESRPRPTFELRSELQVGGVWNEADLSVFDRSMQVRNAVVHGEPAEDLVKPTPREIANLARKIDKASLQGHA